MSETEVTPATENKTAPPQKRVSPARIFKRGAIWLENSALFMYLRAFSRAGIILIALGFFLDMDDRNAATLFRAWQTLTNEAPGNVGKADALAYLVNVGEPLNRIRVRGAYLAEADLAGASLDEADLSDTDLTKANLSDATLIETKLVNAILVGARLDGAFLDEADLQGARLIGADLSGASLDGANLIGVSMSGANISGASFRGALGLAVEQLSSACTVNGVAPVGLPTGNDFASVEFSECAQTKN